MRELSGALEDIVGLRDASGYISVVGQAIGSQIDRDDRAALATPRPTREEVAAVCVDLKRRIKGDFRDRADARSRAARVAPPRAAQVRNSRSAALNASGSSRLLTWPAPGITRLRAPGISPA